MATSVWVARLGRLAFLLAAGAWLGQPSCGDRIADAIIPKVTTCSATTACPPTSPVCDTTTMACRGCKSDRECPSPEANRCDGATGQCVGCLTSATCTGPFRTICDPSARRCVECLSDADCPRSFGTCNPIAGACTLPCSANMDCFIAFPFCDAGVRLCVECREDLECADLGLPHCRALTCAQ